jgi:hypothetical protein
VATFLTDRTACREVSADRFGGRPALPNRRSKTIALGKEFPVTGLDPTPLEDCLPSQGRVEVNRVRPPTLRLVVVSRLEKFSEGD